MSTAPSNHPPLAERLRSRTLAEVSTLMFVDHVYRFCKAVSHGESQGMRAGHV